MCLVRGTTPRASQERVAKSLYQRRLEHDVDALVKSRKLRCVPCSLSDSNLGLDASTYSELKQNTTLIIHSAWAVNFNTRLRSFIKDHIAGLKHILAFTLSSQNSPQVLFCSSIASVTNSSSSPILETVSHDPEDASPLGYSRSKWVAEQICCRVHQHHPSLQSRFKVLRIGQLCGDTKFGIWNMSEAWPLMLSTACQDVVGGLPDLGMDPLWWLPVDKAAEAVIRIADLQSSNTPSSKPDADHTSSRVEATHDVPIYHVLNPDTSLAWEEVLVWMREFEPHLAIYNPSEWLDRLESLKGEKAEHPAKKLIGLWRGAFDKQNEPPKENNDEEGHKNQKEDANLSTFRFDTTRTEAALGHGDLRLDMPVSKELFTKIWVWIRDQQS